MNIFQEEQGGVSHNAGLAQLEERWSHNPKVVSSILTIRIFFFMIVQLYFNNELLRLDITDCRSVRDIKAQISYHVIDKFSFHFHSIPYLLLIKSCFIKKRN